MGAIMTGKLDGRKLNSRWALAKACDGVRDLAHLALEPLEPRTLLTAGPIGVEFLVNGAAGEAWEPAIAMDRDGDFVVAWVSRDSQKGTDAICARRFDASGSPLGGDLPISTQSTHPAQEPHLEHVAVAMDAQHNFVVTWVSYSDRQSGDDIYARRYDAKGQSLGPVFRVNTVIDGTQQRPTLAMNAGGSFVIAWQSEDSRGDADIYVRRFGTSGLPLGGEFRANAYTSGDQLAPALAMDTAGNFLLAWASNGQDGDGTGIYARSYGAAGTAKSNEFRANTTSRGSQACPAVALTDNGSFVIAWEGWGTPDNSGVYAQRFNDQGSPTGGEIRVNSYSESFQQKPAVAMDAAGDCIVTWHSRNQDGSGDGVYAQRYDASGAAQGGESRVNTYTRNDQAHAAVAMDANGNAVVTWESVWQEGVISSIRAQRLATSAISASIRGRVWNDANANSIQDAEEVGVGAVAVTLFTPTGLPIASTTTSTDGAYQFADLLPGQSYYLEVARPQDLVLVLADTGNDDAIDSDIHPATARSETITLTPSQNQATLDAGLTPKTTIRGKIYQDSNSNGTRDEGEPALAGWTVFLDADEDGQLDPGEFTASSSAEGEYVFDDMPPGDYQVAQVPRDLWTLAQPRRITARRGQGAAGVDLANRSAASKLTLTPQGGEFSLYTPQASSWIEGAAVATTNNGDFVTVWSRQATDGTGWNVYGQRYNALGVPQGGEFLVNTTLAGSQRFADVAMDAKGDFVVVWEDGGSQLGVYGQRYNAKGQRQGTEFRVNAAGTYASRPAVAMDARGTFAVAFSGEGIRTQRYNAAGVPQGSAVPASTDLQQGPALPDIDMDVDGDLVVTWMAYGPEGDEPMVYAQRFASQSRPLGNALRAGPSLTGQEGEPSVAMDAEGNFILAWQHNESTPGRPDLDHDFAAFARRFNAAGVPQGNPFRVDPAGDWQTAPKVAMAKPGDFVVSWSDRSGTCQARMYNAAGVPLGEAFKLLMDPSRTGMEPRLAINGLGDLVTTWISEAEESGPVYDAVHARKYKLSRSDAVMVGSADAEAFFLTRRGEETWVYSGTSATGDPLATFPLSQTTSLSIKGFGGNDTLYVDFAQGDPIPAGGLAFDGGQGSDALLLAGTDAADALTVGPERILLNGSPIGPANIEALSFSDEADEAVLLGSLSIDGPARVRLPAGGTLCTGELSIQNGGMLDLMDGNLVLRAAPTTRDQVLDQATDLVKSGRSSGSSLWQGSGIGSLSAHKGRQTGLIVASNDKGDGSPVVSSLGGLALTADDVLVRYTWNGDTNADGVVGSDDYLSMNEGYLHDRSGYQSGDLNYDGSIDAADYFLIDSAYITQGSPAAASSSDASASRSSEVLEANGQPGVVVALMNRLAQVSSNGTAAAPAVWETRRDPAVAGIQVFRLGSGNSEGAEGLLLE